MDVAGVKTEATANDTVELATRPPLPDGAAEPSDETGDTDEPEWTSRLRLTFSSAQRDGGDLTFHGAATYLHDDGGYLLHSADFTVLVAEEQAEGRGGDGAGDGFRTFAAEEAEPLVTLTPDEPTQKFAVTIAGVPEEDDSMIAAGGPTGRYITYETPETLWGHEVAPPDDFIPGRLCYAEGDEWHDLELFEYGEVPCG
nr:hypothetical protein [Nocardiopsis mwathae]